MLETLGGGATKLIRQKSPKHATLEDAIDAMNAIAKSYPDCVFAFIEPDKRQIISFWKDESAPPSLLARGQKRVLGPKKESA